MLIIICINIKQIQTYNVFIKSFLGLGSCDLKALKNWKSKNTTSEHETASAKIKSYMLLQFANFEHLTRNCKPWVRLYTYPVILCLVRTFKLRTVLQRQKL